MDLAELKQQIRQDVLAKRDALPEATRQQFSLKIAKYFSQLDIKPDDVVSMFLPIRSEVDLKPIASQLWLGKNKVCLPFMMSRTEIEFREFTMTTRLIDNGFGTVAPDDASSGMYPDVLLVPLSAYDLKGNRMGYGAGYYDRAIEKLKGLNKAQTLVGVAFSAQEHEDVPVGTHDVPLDYILTENGLHSFA